MSGLYEAILAATGPLPAGTVLSVADVNRPLGALRAVVERHSPEHCRFKWCNSPGHMVCSGCGAWASWPEDCKDTQLIVEKLGITDKGEAK